MCNSCGNYCCGSDEFERCWCDGCPEPDCWSDDAHDIGFGDDMGRPDEDDDGVLMPLVACGCGPRGRFRCEAANRPLIAAAASILHCFAEHAPDPSGCGGDHTFLRGLVPGIRCRRAERIFDPVFY
jgi:hypothetical protein